MQHLTASQLHDRLAHGERLQLVDVRTPAEYAQGHLAGSLNLPLDQVEARVDDLSPRDPVVLICYSGERAALAGTQLQSRRGDLAVLDGGTRAWGDAGLPVVGSVSRRLPIMRQVHLVAGALVLTGTLLSLFVQRGWIGVAIFVGAGLVVAGSTGFCGMAFLLAKMPWNQSAPAPACSK